MYLDKGYFCLSYCRHKTHFHRFFNKDVKIATHYLSTPPAGIDTSTGLVVADTSSQPYWQMATSLNTRKAYQSDIHHFRASGNVLPTTTESVLRYLHRYADSVSPRTLKRRLVAIKQWHIYQNFSDPTAHALIKKTLRGIAIAHGKPAEKAPVISVEQLTMLSSRLIEDASIQAIRDNALLLLGFFGAFRRSELAAIQWQQITFVPEGAEILIQRSKTDQEGIGNVCAIPYGQAPLCPVIALQRWQTHASPTEGFVFRSLRYGRCHPSQGLSPKTVSDILKQRAIECNWPNASNYSGHSLRRGFATAASQRGASLGAIMRQGRWHHEATVHGYIQEGKRFEANAATAILGTPTSSLTPQDLSPWQK